MYTVKQLGDVVTQTYAAMIRNKMLNSGDTHIVNAAHKLTDAQIETLRRIFAKIT